MRTARHDSCFHRNLSAQNEGAKPHSVAAEFEIVLRTTISKGAPSRIPAESQQAPAISYPTPDWME